MLNNMLLASARDPDGQSRMQAHARIILLCLIMHTWHHVHDELQQFKHSSYSTHPHMRSTTDAHSVVFVGVQQIQIAATPRPKPVRV